MQKSKPRKTLQLDDTSLKVVSDLRQLVEIARQAKVEPTADMLGFILELIAVYVAVDLQQNLNTNDLSNASPTPKTVILKE